MIDISEKETITRIATASGKIRLSQKTVERIEKGETQKGDVFTIAKVASINAVKKVPELIPFCHPIPISNIEVDFSFENSSIIKCICTVKSVVITGGEM